MKKTLSLILAVVMMISIIPAINISVFAAEKKLTDFKLNDIIEFGSYPQSEVRNIKLISLLTDLSGSPYNWNSYDYYIGTNEYHAGNMTVSDYMKYTDIEYEGSMYRGVFFRQYRTEAIPAVPNAVNSLQDDNGYSNNTIYWFRYEPLKWRVLDPAKGLIISEDVIDAQAFNNYMIYINEEAYIDGTKEYYANNYEHSSIRQWLNDDFINTAFSSEQQAEINATTISNKSEIDSAPEFDSSDTCDKVYLLSVQEALDIKNKADSSDEFDSFCSAKGTDYAKAQGLSDTYGHSPWTLRSAGRFSFTNHIMYNNYYNSSYIYYTCNGIRPVMNIDTSIIIDTEQETHSDIPCTDFSLFTNFFLAHEYFYDDEYVNFSERVFVGNITQPIYYSMSPANSTEKITWTSSNEYVATVENGILKTFAEGYTIITAETSGGITSSVWISVSEKDASNYITINPGKTMTFNCDGSSSIWLKFVPQVSGTYLIYSSGNNDTDIKLFNSKGRMPAVIKRTSMTHTFNLDLYSQDYWFPDYYNDNFLLYSYFEKGNEYFFETKIRDIDYEASFDITLMAVDADCNHLNISDGPEKEPTCTESGHTAGTYCTDCGEYITGEVIAQLWHTDKNLDNYCDICNNNLHLEGQLTDKISFSFDKGVLTFSGEGGSSEEILDYVYDYANNISFMKSINSIVEICNTVHKIVIDQGITSTSFLIESPVPIAMLTHNLEELSLPSSMQEYSLSLSDYYLPKFNKIYFNSETDVPIEAIAAIGHEYEKYPAVPDAILNIYFQILRNISKLYEEFFAFIKNMQNFYLANKYSTDRKLIDDNFTDFIKQYIVNLENQNVKINNEILKVFDTYNGNIFIQKEDEYLREDGSYFRPSVTVYGHSNMEDDINELNSQGYHFTFVNLDDTQHTCTFDKQVATDEYLASTATCISKATYYYSCECGKKGTETFEYGEVNSENHTAGETVKENIVTATCKVADSYDEVVYCSVCNTELSRETKTGEKLTTHTWNNGETTKAATCKDTGIMTYTCTVCDATKTETIETLTTHTPGETKTENIKAASCTETGSYDEVTYCKVCGKAISSKTVTVEAKGHSYTVIDRYEPTCDSEGYTTSKCSVCGDIKNELLNKTGHLDSDGDGICDRCDTDMSEVTSKCNHLCHKNGFLGFIWKIIRFFCKLFKTNQFCTCGAKHR